MKFSKSFFLASAVTVATVRASQLDYTTLWDNVVTYSTGGSLEFGLVSTLAGGCDSTVGLKSVSIASSSVSSLSRSSLGEEVSLSVAASFSRFYTAII